MEDRQKTTLMPVKTLVKRWLGIESPSKKWYNAMLGCEKQNQIRKDKLYLLKKREE